MSKVSWDIQNRKVIITIMLLLLESSFGELFGILGTRFHEWDYCFYWLSLLRNHLSNDTSFTIHTSCIANAGMFLASILCSHHVCSLASSCFYKRLLDGHGYEHVNFFSDSRQLFWWGMIWWQFSVVSLSFWTGVLVVKWWSFRRFSLLSRLWSILTIFPWLRIHSSNT